MILKLKETNLGLKTLVPAVVVKHSAPASGCWGAAVRFTRSNYFWASCFCTTFLGNVSWQIFLFIFRLIKENWTRDYYSLKTSSFKDFKKKVGCYFSPLLPLSIQGRLRPPVWQVLGWVPWGPDSGRIFLSQVSSSLENAGEKTILTGNPLSMGCCSQCCFNE